jgi:hypothetical protein|tara:strand:- start:461 stop:868 length:408 start_codon:yes stop_codon:yes gene_type:complete
MELQETRVVLEVLELQLTVTALAEEGILVLEEAEAQETVTVRMVVVVLVVGTLVAEEEEVPVQMVLSLLAALENITILQVPTLPTPVAVQGETTSTTTEQQLVVGVLTGKVTQPPAMALLTQVVVVEAKPVVVIV